MDKTTKSVARAAKKLSKACERVQGKLDKLTKLLDIERQHMSEARWNKHLVKIDAAANAVIDELAKAQALALQGF